MFTINHGRAVNRIGADGLTVSRQYIEAACLSTDSKPTTGIVTGSIAVEVDTGDTYFFNEASSEWVKQFSFQG